MARTSISVFNCSTRTLSWSVTASTASSCASSRFLRCSTACTRAARAWSSEPARQSASCCSIRTRASIASFSIAVFAFSTAIFCWMVVAGRPSNGASCAFLRSSMAAAIASWRDGSTTFPCHCACCSLAYTCSSKRLCDRAMVAWKMASTRRASSSFHFVSKASIFFAVALWISSSAGFDNVKWRITVLVVPVGGALLDLPLLLVVDSRAPRQLLLKRQVGDTRLFLRRLRLAVGGRDDLHRVFDPRPRPVPVSVRRSPRRRACSIRARGSRHPLAAFRDPSAACTVRFRRQCSRRLLASRPSSLVLNPLMVNFGPS